MKKKIITLALSCIMVFGISGCSSLSRGIKDIGSDFVGGLDRTVNIYSATGDLIATHSGKIDIEDRTNSILFELDGKRYIYYNAIIEVVEK